MDDTVADGTRQLKEAAPNHPLVLALDEKSKAFDEAAAKFAVTA